jgi:hypothetical protein
MILEIRKARLGLVVAVRPLAGPLSACRAAQVNGAAPAAKLSQVGDRPSVVSGASGQRGHELSAPAVAWSAGNLGLAHDPNQRVAVDLRKPA